MNAVPFTTPLPRDRIASIFAPVSQMSIIVQKFGGTSVADAGRIQAVARRVVEKADRGHRVVVVVSAMGKTTDQLVQMAHQIAPAPSERELDMLLATGEQVSIALLSMAVQALGREAKSFTGHQVGILTDTVYGKARIQRIETEKIERALDEGQIVVVAGFQGVTADDDITTLGRGGSDTTAVALAAALKAEVCEIYTDVDGVYTADPNVVPEARLLDRVSYEEMLELASSGAKVLQSRAVEFAAKYGVPVHVRSSFKPDPGTMVVKEDARMEEVVVRGMAYDRNEAKVSVLGVPDRPGIAAQLFGAVARENIVVDMIVQNISQDGTTDISFTVPRGDRAKAVAVVNQEAERIGARGVIHDDRIAKVSIVGVGMRSHSGVAAKTFSVLAKEGINIMMISTSEIKLSCVIEDKYTELAVRALHEAFGLGKEAVIQE